MSIRGLLVEAANEYATPARLHGEDSFRFSCAVSLASAEEGERLGGALSSDIPQDAREFWSAFNQAELFVDVDYRQWGLVLLGPDDSRKRTAEQFSEIPDDMRPGDIVIGEFLGDLELLILSHRDDESGPVLVSLPLDPREDWYTVGSDLEDFLAQFIENQGRKFWVD